MEILDLKKRYARLYKPRTAEPSLVEVPPLRFLMIDGIGGVGGPDFQLSMAALYRLAYPVKFAAKKRLGLSYPVMPSEGLYEAADDVPGPSANDMAWTLMIMLPDEIDSEFVDDVRETVASKKDVPHLGDVRVQTYSEGTSVQALHVGPYADEPHTISRLLAFAEGQGYEVSGRHHEIYLGNPNRSNPDKLKTLLRYPVRRAGA